jgi:tRNA A-37 threonylcarbamoyl transferase component Bud32/tetratricopeptide (TPR) repeat protein/TolB-like protein
MNLEDQLKTALGASYKIERELGGGGMSRVFVADEVRLGRKVVVKVLAPELAAGISAERFEREIRVAASLQQANIVPVLSAGDASGLPFFTMPFVEGESLRSHLGKTGALSITEIIRILGDVARALTYAHAHGVVHRDIKPDNVLLSGGTAVVTDFGIAKAISASRTNGGGATLTQLGTSIGTPAYMSPEQAAGDPDVDHRSDIYAFGCMAYELLAGRPPFHGRTPQRVLAAHMSETPQPVSEVRPDTPPLLAELVMRSLAKDADQRPQTAHELARILDNVTSGSGMQTMPTALIGGAGMTRRALILYAAAFVVVAIVARSAIIALGLPDWVFPGSLIVMLLGLPVILFTGYVHRTTYRALTATPELTPHGSTRPHGTMATLAIKASPFVSWRRTAIGGAIALGAFVVLVGGFMVLRAFGIGPAASLFAAGTLRDREPILIADFETSAADSALSTVLSQAMRANLSQSRNLALVPTSAVTRALTLMRRPVTTRLTPSLAREIAQREGVRAIVEGSVTPLSGGYIVSARLVAPSGDELVSAQETVDGARGLIPAIDKLGRALRSRAGESLKSVRATPPLARSTTASLPALKKYDEGWRAYNIEADYPTAARLLEEAVALDSLFAGAYRLLSQSYANTEGQAGPRRQATLEKAFQLRDRLSEGERIGVEATYYTSGPHADRARAIDAWETLENRGASSNLLNLATQYVTRREFAVAESLYRRGRIATGTQLQYRMIIDPQIAQGKLAAAESSLAELWKRYPQHLRGEDAAAEILYARGNLDSALKWVAKDAQSTNAAERARGRGYLAATAMLRGQFAEWRKYRVEQRASNESRGFQIASSLADSVTAATVEGWFYDRPDRGQRLLDRALVSVPLTSTRPAEMLYLQVAEAYAILGNAARAKEILAQYDRAITDTARRRLDTPERQVALGWIAIAENRPMEAVALFRRSDSLPDGPRTFCSVCIDPDIGRAFDRAEMPDSAIAAFEHFMNTPAVGRWTVTDNWNLAWISKRLGELYEAKGNRAKAAAYYTKFVDLWKNADPELQPKVAQVRARLARLKDVEPQAR